METTLALDFKTYTNADLRYARDRINADKFPENLQACLAEIQRRQELGEWSTEEAPAVLSQKKSATIALGLGLLLLVGGAFGLVGFGLLIATYYSYTFDLKSIINLTLGVLLFSASFWAGYKLCKDRRDWNGLAFILFGLQSVSFSYGGLVYLFSVGTYVPLGWNGNALAASFSMISQATFSLTGVNEPFTFHFNMAALIALSYLRKINLANG